MRGVPTPETLKAAIALLEKQQLQIRALKKGITSIRESTTFRYEDLQNERNWNRLIHQSPKERCKKLAHALRYAEWFMPPWVGEYWSKIPNKPSSAWSGRYSAMFYLADNSIPFFQDWKYREVEWFVKECDDVGYESEGLLWMRVELLTKGLKNAKGSWVDTENHECKRVVRHAQ